MDAGFERLRQEKQAQELELTLDAGLQPALDITQGRRKKADEIFEKEQQMLAESAAGKQKSKSKDYINEHGFLTQTAQTPRLAMVSPLFTRTQAISPLTRKGPMAPPLVPRQPLAAIELGMEGDVEEDQPRRRLVKRQSSPTRSNSLEVRDASPSPSPSKSRNSKPRNVFDVMQRAANLQHRDAAKTERRLQKSEFIEGEAEESDDDAMMGFGPRNKVDEDEEDDESQDQTLTELVDDAAMDAETLAEHAVIEKHREHQQIDDEANEKLQKDVVAGNWKTKRRDRGIGFEDSDSEDDDDDDAKARRRKMSKKRRIEDDSLEQLAKNPETLAFVQAYHADDADGDDFAHLQQDEMTLINEQDQENVEDDEPEYVSTTELTRQLREAAQDVEAHRAFDPHDVSWVEQDADDDEGIIPVKEVQKQFNPRRGADLDAALEMKRTVAEDERDRARLQTWAKGESRTAGSSRSTGISAVTGSGKRKPGRGPLSDGQRAVAKSTTRVSKSSSALSAVTTSRRSKFQN